MTVLQIRMQTRNGSIVESEVLVPRGIKNIEDSTLIKLTVKQVYEEWNKRQEEEDL